MSATLVNAVLGYRLVVANHGTAPLTRLTVAGDMVSAHASRPASELLGPDGGQLPSLHRIEQLAPGESLTFGGEMRLPLSAITPIRRGDAALFVPLARVRVEGLDAAGQPLVAHGTFLVGQPAASERLQPFRLDLGPRLYSHVAQQLLAEPA